MDKLVPFVPTVVAALCGILAAIAFAVFGFGPVVTSLAAAVGSAVGGTTVVGEWLSAQAEALIKR